MKKILIALDYDRSAEIVADTGYSIAKAFNAEVMLVHVIDEPAYYSSVDYSPIMGFSGFNSPDQYKISQELEKEARRFLKESRKHLGDENIEIIVADGDFTEGILYAASQSNADMIVMGTHHRRGLDKMLMGNLSEKILRETNIPVLVIPTTRKEKDK